jgi:hypothetical protein
MVEYVVFAQTQHLRRIVGHRVSTVWVPAAILLAMIELALMGVMDIVASAVIHLIGCEKISDPMAIFHVF